MLEFPLSDKNTDSKLSAFSHETIDSVTELGSVLLKIHNRLLSEGYCIMADRVINPQGEVEYEKLAKHR